MVLLTDARTGYVGVIASTIQKMDSAWRKWRIKDSIYMPSLVSLQHVSLK